MSVEGNKAVIRRYREIYNGNRLDELGEVVAGDLISHTLLPGLPPGLEGARQAHRVASAAFEGLRTVTEDLIAEGDRVVERFTTYGRHVGEFIGLPPTGKDTRVSGISIFRLAGGKVVEHWAQMDEAGLLRQLGVLPGG
jgi:predicted ester cyclase